MEDVNKCVQALQERDPENVDRTAGQIRGRTARLEDVVTAEMENYQQGPYTDNVMRAVMYMRNEGKNSSLYVIKKYFYTRVLQSDQCIDVLSLHVWLE